MSRFERPGANPQLETVRAYLGALGYALELQAIDAQTGEAAAKVVLPPDPAQHSPRPARPSRRR